MSRPIVLITGASGGIGAACVRRFLSAGWRISATALAGPDLESLSGRDVLVLPGDLTSDQTRRKIVERTVDHYGRIDVLVNNAGVGLYGQPSSLPVDLAGLLFELNVLAPLAMAQLVIPVMRRLGSGSIVNVGSVGGYVSLPWAAAYCASKFALLALNDALRRELRKDCIHVMNVSPGIVDTSFRNNVLAGVAPPKVMDLRWVVSPDAVAAGILNGIRKRRRTVYVPRIGRLFRLVDLLCAPVMDWYTGRLLKVPEIMQAPIGQSAVQRSVPDFICSTGQPGAVPLSAGAPSGNSKITSG